MSEPPEDLSQGPLEPKEGSVVDQEGHTLYEPRLPGRRPPHQAYGFGTRGGGFALRLGGGLPTALLALVFVPIVLFVGLGLAIGLGALLLIFWAARALFGLGPHRNSR